MDMLRMNPFSSMGKGVTSPPAIPLLKKTTNEKENIKKKGEYLSFIKLSYLIILSCAKELIREFITVILLTKNYFYWEKTKVTPLNKSHRKTLVVDNETHQDLLAKGGLYKTLWEAQVGGFLPDMRKDRP